MKPTVLHYAVAGEIAQAWHIEIIAKAESRGWETVRAGTLFAPDVNRAIDFLVANYPNDYELAK
mgnify:CR=1 FL=1